MASKLTATVPFYRTKVCATADVVEHAALYYHATTPNTLVLAGGTASTLRFAGFARYARATAGLPVEYGPAGIGEDIAVASAAIAVGDPLESYGTAGRVRTKPSGSGTVIGYALTAAAADGDLVLVETLRTA